MRPFLPCLAAATGLLAGAAKGPEPTSPFLRHCARCHGSDGGGRGAHGERLPGGRINDAAKLTVREEAALVRLILEGRGAMPGFRGKLGTEEAGKLALQVLKGPERRR